MKKNLIEIALIALSLLSFKSNATCQDLYSKRAQQLREMEKFVVPVGVATLFFVPNGTFLLALSTTEEKRSELEGKGIYNNSYYKIHQLFQQDKDTIYWNQFYQDVDPLTNKDKILMTFKLLDDENFFCRSGLYSYEELIELIRSNL